MHRRKKKRNGYTIIEALVIVLIISILVLISTPNMMRARMQANEANALNTLRTLAEAVKMYSVNSSKLPADVTDLLRPSNSYLKKNYCGTTKNGYTFSCTFGSDSYQFAAVPDNLGITGMTSYTMTTGGVLRP